MSFVTAHARPVVFFIISVVIALWSVASNFRGSFISAGFSLLISASSLVAIAIHLIGVVTRFRLGDGTLEFVRLAHGARRITLDEIASVQYLVGQDLEASLWLIDGTTLSLPLKHLSGGRELIAELKRYDTADGQHIEGFIGRRQLASVLVYQCCVTSLLVAVAVPASLSLAIGIAPKNLVANPVVFLGLGFVSLVFCIVVFYFAVLNYWVGSVRSFRWDGRCLEYRTAFSSILRQRLASDVVKVSAKRALSRQGEAGSSRSVLFRDGDSIKLHLGILHHAEELFLALKGETVRQSPKLLSLPIFDRGHCAWSAIEPYLEEGESVVWLGKPVYGLLWSEMSAEVAAPFRYRKMLRDTVYAVTSRRAIVLGGCTWGTQSMVEKQIGIKSFDLERVRRYEVTNSGRDIVLDGLWRNGRKRRRYWMNLGFLAPDEPLQAEEAMRRFIVQNWQLSHGRTTDS